MIADQVDVVMQVKDQAYLARLKTDERAFLSTMKAVENSSSAAGTALVAAGSAGANALGKIAAAAVSSAAAVTRQAQADLQALKAAEGTSREAIRAAQAVLQKARASEAAARASAADAAAARSEAAALGAITPAANSANAATRQLSNNTGNLAAQFNDIGVQLAGGQSPLLIALQQGSQINQVLGQAGAGGAVKALAGAFASLLNPVSLSTIAIISLAGYAVQYFGSILTEGQQSSEVIKEQNDLIRKVAENWGDAVPALKAYVDQLDRAAEVSDTNQAFDILVGQEFEAAKQQLEDIRVGFADARIALQQFGADASVIDNLQSEFDTLREKVANNTATTEDLERLQSLLAGTVGAESIPALVALSGVLDTLSQALGIAAANTATLRAEQAALNNADAQVDAFNTNRDFVAEQERLNSLTTEQLALEREVASVKADAAGDDILISEQQALEIAQGRLSAEERRLAIIKANNAATKAGGGAASEAERERKAVLDLISALQFEQGLIGLTNAEKAVQNALRRAGAAATDEERAAIEELITATYQEQEALAAAEAAMGAFENMAGNALGTFLNDIRQGKDAAESLSNIFDDIAGQLIQMAAQGLVRAAFGGLFGGGGGLLGGLFGGRGFASGTANTGGNRGEVRGVVHGQEAVIPLPSGGKVPVQIKGGVGAAGGEVVVRVVSGEMFTATVEKISGDVSARVVSSGIASYDSNLSSRMVEQDARNN